uniref:Uncharacterized protein n=1 Tax=Pseudo-nitzschia australis TaxID=44445 RepID=A0A7S4AEF8_9STRA
MGATVTDRNHAVADCQALALMTLLETFHPRVAFEPYLMQLKTIVKDLEEEEKLNDCSDDDDDVYVCDDDDDDDDDDDEGTSVSPVPYHNIVMPCPSTFDLDKYEDCIEESAVIVQPVNSYASNSGNNNSKKDKLTVARVYGKIKSSLSMNSPLSASTKLELRRNHSLPEHESANLFESMSTQEMNTNANMTTTMDQITNEHESANAFDNMNIQETNSNTTMNMDSNTNTNAGVSADADATKVSTIAPPNPLPPLYSPTRHPRNKAASPNKPYAPARTQSPIRSVASSLSEAASPNKPYAPSRTQSPIRSVASSSLEAALPNKPYVPSFTHPPIRSSASSSWEAASPNKLYAPTRTQSPMRSVASSQTQSRLQVSSPRQQQMQQPFTIQRSPSFTDRYHDKNRFLDDANIVFPTQRLNEINAAITAPKVDPVSKAFETSEILERILAFDGSLAAYHKNYDLIEGYKSPMRRRRSQSRFQRRDNGSCHLAFVNKRFASLVLGPEGLKAWKVEARLQMEGRKRIARQIMSGAKPSPLAKVFAIVIRNDAIEFEYLLSKHVISIQQGTSLNNDHGTDIFGMALMEYVKGGDDQFQESEKKYAYGTKTRDSQRTMGLPREHAFLKFCSCWKATVCDYTTLLAELAYNAVVCGALDVLGVLSARHNTLYSTAFGLSGSQTLLGYLVAQVCAQPCCLEEVAQGIRTLMAYQRFHTEELHDYQRGSLGTSLHMAAAKGDRELVHALLDIGCDPSIRCDQRAIMGGENNNGNRTNSNVVDQLWYPEDWARVRGHTRVAGLLGRRRRRLQPQQDQNPSSELQSVLTEASTRVSADPSYQDYDDSDSSCGSDEYDSDSDVFDSEDDASETDDDDDYSEYDTEDSSRFDRSSNYAFTTRDRYRRTRLV